MIVCISYQLTTAHIHLVLIKYLQRIVYWFRFVYLHFDADVSHERTYFPFEHVTLFPFSYQSIVCFPRISSTQTHTNACEFLRFSSKSKHRHVSLSHSAIKAYTANTNTHRTSQFIHNSLRIDCTMLNGNAAQYGIRVDFSFRWTYEAERNDASENWRWETRRENCRCLTIESQIQIKMIQ